LLAGGLALVDQALRQSHHQDIGLANPLLYAIGHSASAATVISDVTANNNDMGQSLTGKPFGCCTASPGYDEASGLGSINLASLAVVAGTLVPRVVNVGLSVPAQRHPVADKHLLAKVTCSGHCLMGAYARITVGSSKKATTRYSGVALLKNGGHRTVKIGLDKKTVSRLRSALDHHQKVIATIFGAILDPSGNIVSRTQGKALRLQG
jgi:hypothetical protein